jgi:hypothetical protein
LCTDPAPQCNASQPAKTENGIAIETFQNPGVGGLGDLEVASHNAEVGWIPP